MYTTLKFLHIILMFLAVALSIGPELLLSRIAKTGDVRAIRTSFAMMKPLGMLIPITFTLGMILGLITAANGDLDFTAPWLLISYVLFVIAMGIGGAITGPWMAKVGQAAAKSPDEKPSEELSALLNAPTITYATWASILLVMLLVGLMVFKPGL